MKRCNQAIFGALACLLLTALGNDASFAQNTDVNPLDSVFSRLNQIYVQSGFLNTTDASETELMLRGAIDRAGELYGARSDEAIQATLDLCRLYKMQSRYGEMTARLRKVASLYGDLSPASKVKFAPNLLEQARVLCDQNKVSEAKIILPPIIAFVKTDPLSARDANVERRLAELGQALKGRGEYTTCETIYRAQLAACERRTPVNETDLADARAQLAEILKENGNTSTALELAVMAMEGYEKAGTEPSKRGISNLVLLSTMYLASEKTRDAQALAGKLNNLLSRAHFQERKELVQPVLSLCIQFAQVNDAQTVSDLFSRTLEIADRYSCSYYDGNLREISRCLTASGNTETAEKLYLELESWAERPGSVADRNFRSQVMIMTTRFYADAQMIDKLIAAMTKVASYDRQFQTNNLANLQSDIESTQDVRVRERLYSLLAGRVPRTPYECRQQAQYHIRLAEIFLAQERNNDAREQWYTVTTMLEDSLPPDCKDLGAEVRSVLERYVDGKRFQDAQQLANNMASYGFDQNILTSTVNGFIAIARYQEGFGNTDRAIKLIERALTVAEKNGGQQTYNYCEALTEYAQLLKKNGKLELAAEKEKQATDLREKLQRAGGRRYG